jgi:hypothetical protein
VEPYVLGCGGTAITLDAARKTIASEVVGTTKTGAARRPNQRHLSASPKFSKRWDAFIALLNEQRGQALGFLNSKLY